MPHGITYTWNLNYDTNKQKYVLHRHGEQTLVAKGEGEWRREGLRVGISRCKLLCRMNKQGHTI